MFLSLRKSKIYFLILIILFSCSLNHQLARAAEGFEENYNESNDISDLDYEDPVIQEEKKTKSRSHRKLHEINDSAFVTDKGVTLKDLAMSVSMILLVLLGILAFVKFYLSKNNITQPGNLFDDLAQKVFGGFSGVSVPQGAKLKQTLVLTPGQNLYLVEIEGKKLLLGGTNQGGVQFLTDLNNNSVKLNEHQNNLKSLMPYELSTAYNPANQAKDLNLENPFLVSATNQENMNLSNNSELQLLSKEKDVLSPSNTSSRQPFKRRTSFRQSLSLSKT